MNKHFKKLLNNKNFMSLWISQSFSQIAIHLLNFAIILKVFEETNSPVAASLVWLAFILPSIIFGPIAASAVDHTDRRTILVYTNLVQAILVVFYAIFQEDLLYVSYVVVFMYAIVNQLYIPAELAVLSQIVKSKHIAYANSLFLLTYQLALGVGYGLAGLISQMFGLRITLLFAATLVFLAYLSVTRLPSLRVMPKKKLHIETRITRFFMSLAEGYHFIRGNRVVLVAFSIIIILQVTLAIITVNLPIFAQDILKVQPSWSGLLAIPTGVGAALGVFIVSKLISKHGRLFTIVKMSLILMTVIVWSILFLIPILRPFPKLFLMNSLLVVAGACYVGIYIPAQTILQLETPKDMIGRVFGNSWFVTTLMTVAPILFSATITEIFGPRFLIFVAGVLLIVVNIWFGRWKGSYTI